MDKKIRKCRNTDLVHESENHSLRDKGSAIKRENNTVSEFVRDNKTLNFVGSWEWRTQWRELKNDALRKKIDSREADI